MRGAMRFSVVLGTRPEMVKMSPIVRELQRLGDEFDLVHTGQHYSYDMDKVFFQDLELPDPTVNLEVGSGTHGAQTGKMLAGLEKVFEDTSPEMVLVQGDTNTVLAGALAAVKMDIPVGHVEAGLRSFDRGMPEEVNRVLADHMSSLLFAPTTVSAENLRAEGVPDQKIFVTGNTIVDAVRENLRLAMNKGDALRTLGLTKGGYVLATLHRQENVDSEVRMRGVLQGLGQVARETGQEVLWPMHPRTRKNLEAFHLTIPDGVRAIAPIGFLEFLQVEGSASLALTDSGGVQEECCILGVPCVTLRENTERPETVQVGANVVVGTDPTRIVAGAKRMMGAKGDWICPLGESGAGARIVDLCHRLRMTQA
ncbi:MAG: UDP-N-acetylglucosamine 2-epimerase (non-hydrolyzing) [Methanomassiliicoccales archaeon]|nr:UDP-N-acetylglucosamine 2-epimerase (non-hydrolyzing) [Methanomassiliicoccales archaeon]